MIRYLLIFILGLSITFGQKQTQEKKPAGRANSTEPRASASAEKSTAIVIPAGAVEVYPGTYKHTDSSGKNWIYRKTPFGVAKMADTPEAASKASDAKPEETPPPKAGNPFGDSKTASANSAAPSVTAVEEGDMVRFERSTPFGPARWTRKKSELNADEEKILEQSRARKSENTGTKE
jgi:hypothetical protein